jgi:hypothetical protein
MPICFGKKKKLQNPDHNVSYILQDKHQMGKAAQRHNFMLFRFLANIFLYTYLRVWDNFGVGKNSEVNNKKSQY